jgi:hypothetical protein
VAAVPGQAAARVTSPLPLGPSSLLRDLIAPVQPGRVIVGESVLNSVFCTSRTNCWAVGGDEINDVFLNQALHFNGKKWAHVPTPDPGGTAINDSSRLRDVRCTSPSNCWAVGSYDKHGAAVSEALRWNGKKWSLVATPNPAGTANKSGNELRSIRCTSASFCWTVGLQEQHGDSGRNEALRWNGTKWTSG